MYEQLKDAPKRAGRGVTAGKLLCAKRPALFPIYDSQVRRSLGVSLSNSWHAIWFALREPVVRDGLESLREEVPEAHDRSLARVLDIIAWMDGSPSS